MSLPELYNKYFLVNLNDYSNIEIDFEINKILFFFFVGIIFATIIVNLSREVNTAIIKALMRHEVYTEEDAKTLSDLKLNKFTARMALSSSSRLSKLVKRVGAKEYTYEEYSALIKEKGFKEEKIDFENAKFYLSEEGIDDAKRIAEANVTSPLNTILFCLLLLAVYVCLMFTIPEILTFINKFLAK